MQAVHVYFVSDPSTPSSSFSPFTAPFFAGPHTQLPVWYSPFCGTTSARLFPRLDSAPPPYMPSPHPPLVHVALGPELDWDLTLPAQSARLQRFPHISPYTLATQPAMNPPLPALVIICEHLPQWMIEVRPTPNTNRTAAFVTVGNVLRALYRTLRQGVTDAELSALEPAQRDRAHDAYVRRYRRLHGATRAREKAKGVKRVDLLGKRRVFRGLLMVYGGLPAQGLPHGVVWALNVAETST